MSATLQRKVQKLLSSKARFDTPEMLQATEGLSDFYSPGDNTRDNRRKLRSLLERRSVHIHHSLVTAFAPVQSQLTALNTSLSSLLTLCDSTLAHLTAVKQHNTLLVQQTEQHRREQQQLQSKRELASAFLNKFQLSASDVETIEAGEIGDEFFASLARIGQIREDCKQLLSSFHQRVALDILDSLAKRLETGYERLYRHVQSQCSQLLSLPAPGSAFVSALTLLRAMPVYYDHCMSEMAQAHRLALIQRFMAAMTRGEAGSRPMDMQAHDSVRYVGDILAWVHQQAASERDFIAQLMSMVAQQHQTFASSASAASSSSLLPLPPEERQRLEAEQAAFLSATFEGLSRLLRTRVEQALTTQPTPETAFKLYQLLLFYAATISPLFPPTAGFRLSLSSMADSARVNFFDIVKKQGERVAASPPSCPADLSPPQVLTEAAGQLTAILTITSSSVAPASTPASSFSSSSLELAPVLAALLDPLLAAIQSAASSLPADDQCVYSINCLTGDHRVLTRSGWKAITRMQVGDMVLTFNVASLAMEWKPVRTVHSHAVNPRRAADDLFRMQGSGMDVIATRDHRMLIARSRKSSATGLQQGKRAVDYETVNELLGPPYTVGNTSRVSSFAHSQVRAVVCAGDNRQPGVKVVIPGMEQVCDWWWQQDGQLGFLAFLGFWLADGWLSACQGFVGINQKQEAGKQWLEQLLPRVFPRWYSNAVSTALDHVAYVIRCPPLYAYLRLMAAGPLGYNPRDPQQLRSYPHFTKDEGLAAEEQKSDYYTATNNRGRVSTWTEAAMLAAFNAERCYRRRAEDWEPSNEMLLCEGCQRGGHLQCLVLSAVPEGDWLCPASCASSSSSSSQARRSSFSAATTESSTSQSASDERRFSLSGDSNYREEKQGKEEKEGNVSPASLQPMDSDEPALEEGDGEAEVPLVDAVEGDDEAEVPLLVQEMRVAGRVVWWNKGLWIIIDGCWFYLKRWLGDQQQIAEVYSQLSRRQAVALLDGFCRADAEWKRVQYDDDSGEPTGQWRCSSSSFPLIDQLMLIGQLAGAAVDLRLHTKAGRTRAIDARRVTFSVDHWALFFTFTRPARLPMQTAPLAQPVDVSKDVEARGYYDYEDDGRVWCITVDDDTNFLNANFLTQRLSCARLECGRVGVRAHSVFVGNCLQVVVSLLRRYEVARGRYEIMSLMLESELERLVGLQYDAVMDRCGMKDVVERMRAEDRREAEAGGAEHVQRSAVAGLDETTVSGAVRSFYSQLFSIGSFLVPQADRILQSHLRRSCRENVALCISAAYREVYDMVRDERNAYTAGGSGWLQHEPQHIDLVLEVKGRGDVGRVSPTVRHAVLATPTGDRTAAAASPSSSSPASGSVERLLRTSSPTR